MNGFPIYYLAISNGDFNDKCRGLVDLANTVEFEMGVGCQKFAVVTDKPLTPEAYFKLQEFLSDSSNYERIVKAI